METSSAAGKRTKKNNNALDLRDAEAAAAILATDPSEEVAAALRGIAHVKTLPGLSDIQTRRTFATVAGMKPSAIAKAEGVSRQSVSESIAAPAVKGALRDLVQSMRVREYNFEDVVCSDKPIVQYAMEVIGQALSANRVVVIGSGHLERPDWPTRLAAANRILAFYEPTPIAPEKTPVLEEVAIEETIRRATSRRSRI